MYTSINTIFFVQILPALLAVSVLYLTDKNNIERLIYCYQLHSAFYMVVSIPIGILVIKGIMKKNNQQKNDDVDKDSQNKLEIISVSNSKQFSEMKMVKSQLIMQMLR